MKKHFRSLVSALLAAILAISLFAGCGGPASGSTPSAGSSDASSSPSSPAQETGEEEPVTITFMSWGPSEAITTPVYEQLKENFEKENPNITIEYVSVPFGNMKQQAFIYAAADDLPDIVESHSSWVPSFVSSDIMMPLDGLFSEEFLADFLPGAMQECRYDGQLKAIPKSVTPVVLFYNTTLFEQAGLDPDHPPETYDEMLEMAEKLAALKTPNGDEIYGLGECVSKAANVGQLSTRNWYNFNALSFDEAGRMQFDKEAAADVLGYYRSLVTSGIAPQSALPKDLRNLFAQGRLGMMFDICSTATINLLSGKGKDFEKEYRVAPVPVNRTGENTTISVTYYLSVAKTCEHPEAAAKVIEYFTSQAGLEAYVEADNPFQPARLSIMDEPVFNTSDAQKLMREQYTEYNEPMPPNNPQLEQAYIELVTAIQSAMQTDEELDKIAEDLYNNLVVIFS